MVTDTLLRGRGRPVTVFAHGLGGGIADTRPLASGVSGTRVFYTARAHDGVAVPRVDYAGMADDLDKIADTHHATRAVGVSMGAAALCRLLSRQPDRFERVVFFLPPILDAARAGSPSDDRLWEAADSGDAERVTRLLEAELPDHVSGTPAGHSFAAARAATLTLPSMRGVPAAVAAQPALGDTDSLREVAAAALVLGCRGDPTHPAQAAERLAETLPNATLHLYDGPHVVWTRRADLRQRIAGFLAG